MSSPAAEASVQPMQYGVTEPSASGEIVRELVELRGRHQSQGLKNLTELPVLRKRLGTLPNVEFVKVAGHAGVPENERCDELARAAITRRT